VPCDSLETKKATIALGKMTGPAYFRFAREKTPVITISETPFLLGRAEVFREGTDVVVIASGPVLYNGLLAAVELEREGISVMVVNNHTIKPIDEKTIIAAAKKCGAVVTLEEHQIMGGAGSAVVEVLARNYPVPVEMVGVIDHFGESGEPNELIEKYGMGKDRVKEAIQTVLQRKLKT
jgi:transketolase